MTEKDLPSDPPSPDTVNGYAITLPSGARVWMARHDKSVILRFTSAKGGVIDLRLSREAIQAVFDLYQLTDGFDEDLISVTLVPKEDGNDG